MAGRISGLYVAVTASGAILVWSGWKGATVADTLKSLLAGNLNAADTQSVGGASAGGSSSSAASPASQNYLTIAQYLVSNGYSHAAAAGIVACIAGESGGNPEAIQGGKYGNPASNPSGGEGLIQWTPASSYPGLVTGNASADLDAQLAAIIAYNNAQGPNLVQMLNQIADPVQAADFYSRYFERPAIANSDVVAGVATSVYNELNGTGVATGKGGGSVTQKIAAAVG